MKHFILLSVLVLFLVSIAECYVYSLPMNFLPPTSGLDNMDTVVPYNGSTYFFKGNQYFLYADVWLAVALGYPKTYPDSFWTSIPTSLDGACSVSNSANTFFFKGAEYWAVDPYGNTVIIAGNISTDWPGVPNNIDDCYLDTNGYTYFLQGSYYYRWDPSIGMVSSGYPKTILAGFGTGFPTNIDAIFVWPNDNITYAFKGSNYWSYLFGSVAYWDPSTISYWEGTFYFPHSHFFKHKKNQKQKDVYLMQHLQVGQTL